jgi:hypothetical protein
MKAVFLAATLVAACTHPNTVNTASPQSPADESCAAIASDIELLRARFPQLVEYRTAAAMHRDCVIEYGWHIGRPTGRGGGWTAQVPDPERDGVWFYVGLYDPNGPEANDQINSQPIMPADWRIGARKVTLLVVEGADTHGIGAAVIEVLRRHGMRLGMLSP